MKLPNIFKVDDKVKCIEQSEFPEFRLNKSSIYRVEFVGHKTIKLYGNPLNHRYERFQIVVKVNNSKLPIWF
jgi:hypothetical protein